MPRTLTPISNKQVEYYEEKIKSAYSQNDKKNVRRYKRLFSVYIKKRGLDISFFKNHKIYRFFDKPKKADQLKKELENLKTEKADIKSFIEYVEIFNPEYKKIAEKYILERQNEIDIKTKIDILKSHYHEYDEESLNTAMNTMWIMENIYNTYKKYMKATTDKKTEIIERKIKRLENKKEYMREYRKRILTNVVVDDNKKIDKLLDELPNKIDIMLKEYNKIEEQLKKKEEQLLKFRDKMLKKYKLYEVLNGLTEKKIYPCYFLFDVYVKGFLPNTQNENEFFKMLEELLEKGNIDKKHYDDSIYFITNYDKLNNNA